MRTLAAVQKVAISIGASLGCLLGPTALAEPTARVTLTRLECGSETANPLPMFSDTYAHKEGSVQLTYSCYLIRHGDDYMLWNAGNPVGTKSVAGAKVGLVELLAQLDLRPERVKYLGLSHWHADHIGQAASFPQSTLLIGRGDWELLTGSTPPAGPIWLERLVPVSRTLLKPWISDGAKVDLVSGDKDVFGDGSVVMLSMAGHTPGHYTLLVRLKEMGNVLLSGDLIHFRENYDAKGVPVHNSNRADSLASLERFREIARNLDATVVIEHDPRDVGKLPAFPAAGD